MFEPDTHLGGRVIELTGPMPVVGVDAPAIESIPDLHDDDGYLNALLAGQAPDRLGETLLAWRTAVCGDDTPILVDDDTACAVVALAIASHRADPDPDRLADVIHLDGGSGARHRLPSQLPAGWRRHLAAPMIAAAALAGMLCVGVGSYTEAPDGPLWPLTQQLWGDHASSVAAAYQVAAHIDAAKHWLSTGRSDLAAAELTQASADLTAVQLGDGRDQLAAVTDFLLAKADETTPGVPVDPAAPLARDPLRPVPAGCGLGLAVIAAGVVAIARPTMVPLPPAAVPTGVPVIPPPGGGSGLSPVILEERPPPPPAPVSVPSVQSSAPAYTPSATPTSSTSVGNSDQPAVTTATASPPSAEITVDTESTTPASEPVVTSNVTETPASEKEPASTTPADTVVTTTTGETQLPSSQDSQAVAADEVLDLSTVDIAQPADSADDAAQDTSNSG